MKTFKQLFSEDGAASIGNGTLAGGSYDPVLFTTKRKLPNTMPKVKNDDKKQK